MLGPFILFQISSAIFLRFFVPAGPVYYSIVLLHITSGVGIILMLLFHGKSRSKQLYGFNKTVRHLLTATLSFGILLAFNGSSGALGELLFTAHVLSVTGFLISFFILERIEVSDLLTYGAGLIAVFSVLVSANVLVGFIEKNNVTSEKTDFYPSPAQTVSKKYLNHASIDRSFRCGTSGCHPDIHSQWQQSAHRLSSFNNPFYTGSVDYLLSSGDSTTVRWCAGCHDPVMLHTGLLKGRPDKNIPEAHSGITCEVCHSIVEKPDITGNGKYIIGEFNDYPFSRSEGILSKVNNMLIRVDPRAHKKNMLKPFHSESEYCLTCHKVSLDVPINHYRWLRGQDEYDAWHHSGVSGNAVASFYAPPISLKCQDCHMAYERSQDKGHDAGQVRGHYFNAANTALPALPDKYDSDWIDRTSEFMKDHRVSVDIFGVIRDRELFSPIKDTVLVKPGETVQLEIVIRTHGIGHRFPGGTIDSNEPWLQLEIKDKYGKTVYGNGLLESNLSVAEDAHFFRGVLLDKYGEFIQKRNPHEWVTTLYNNTIPPGSADVVHYIWEVPEVMIRGHKIIARLNYRKFNRSITETFLGDIPALPIVTMASDSVMITNNTLVGVAEKTDALRYNDYGIGMLRQNNLEAARIAFEQVNKLNPQYADGYVNLARVLIKEGKFSNADLILAKAIEIEPGFPKANYFLGLIQKKLGQYTEAVRLFNSVKTDFPNDRVLLKELGQTYYYMELYNKALRVFHNVLEIDPEDSEAHYNLILINKNLGNISKSRHHKDLYVKYKIDEEARSISQTARLKYPHANNEAQIVHTHSLFLVHK